LAPFFQSFDVVVFSFFSFFDASKGRGVIVVAVVVAVHFMWKRERGVEQKGTFFSKTLNYFSKF
jgi:hypothetical protein